MGSTRAALIAGVAGFAVMSVELTAVRYMAPHFGDSAYVWTNVIGVILVALALGAWLGGRAADAERGSARLALVFVASGLTVALAPLLGDPLGRWLLPADLPLDAAMGALVRGSLAATTVLFAPPVLLAGMATPILVVLLAARTGQVGRATGHVAAWSTIGSLCGTFLTTHLMVPGIGSRATLWLAAGALIVCALIARGTWRSRAAAALAVPALLALIPTAPRRALPAGAELLAELETPYQYLRVVRMPGNDGAPPATFLKINEGLDSFHSVKIAGSDYTGGLYYDYFAVLPFLVGDGRRPAQLRVASLGAAAGTFERVYGAAHPGAMFDSVELDPAVVELGRRHFDGFPVEGRIHRIDARVFVERTPEHYEVALVDAYERQIYIPAHVASREFFAAVERRLVPGGVVGVNVGGRTFEDPVVRVLGATMRSVFGGAWGFRVPQSRNFMLVARRGAALDPGVLRDIEVEDPELRAILAVTAQPGSWQELDADEPVLVDDRPFLDRLQEVALALRYDRAAPLPMDGAHPAGEVEQESYALLRSGELERLRELLSTADRPTAYLRFLAGDCRWRLRDLAGARAEYAAARELGIAPELADALAARQRDVAAELAGVERARGVAARNGWLAALAGVAWFGLAGLALRGSRAFRTPVAERAERA